MNKDRYDSIAYDFDNTSTAQPADSVADFSSSTSNYTKPNTNTNHDADSAQAAGPLLPNEESKRGQREVVVIFQLIVCILLAAAAFVIKSIGGDLYESVHSIYTDTVNNSIIFQENTETSDQAAHNIIDDIITSQN